MYQGHLEMNYLVPQLGAYSEVAVNLEAALEAAESIRIIVITAETKAAEVAVAEADVADIEVEVEDQIILVPVPVERLRALKDRLPVK